MSSNLQGRPFGTPARNASRKARKSIAEQVLSKKRFQQFNVQTEEELNSAIKNMSLFDSQETGDDKENQVPEDEKNQAQLNNSSSTIILGPTVVKDKSPYALNPAAANSNKKSKEKNEKQKKNSPEKRRPSIENSTAKPFNKNLTKPAWKPVTYLPKSKSLQNTANSNQKNFKVFQFSKPKNYNNIKSKVDCWNKPASKLSNNDKAINNNKARPVTAPPKTSNPRPKFDLKKSLAKKPTWNMYYGNNRLKNNKIEEKAKFLDFVSDENNAEKRKIERENRFLRIQEEKKKKRQTIMMAARKKRVDEIKAHEI